MMESTSASPMPLPRTALLPLKNLPLTLPRSSGGMPRPWSMISTKALYSPAHSLTVIRPPGAEYLMALF